MTLAEDILVRLKASDRALDDDELADLLGVRRQAVNQECRRLEALGKVRRMQAVGFKIRNRLADLEEPSNALPVETAALVPSITRPSRPTAHGFITEDEVKQAVRDHLQDQGFEVAVAGASTPGVDIEARRGDGRLLIEAKGEVERKPQNANYFLGAIGELVQRMPDPDARYGLALPGNRQYRGLVARLPALARQRLCLEVFFVERGSDGTVRVSIPTDDDRRN